MPDISIISHFYNFPRRVRDQIVYWETLPADILSRVEFILVDDCSLSPPLFLPSKLDLKVFRITTDVPWNQSGARNLGTIHASGEWAIYFDIDQKIQSEPLMTLLNNIRNLDPSTMYYLKCKNYHDINQNSELPCHPNTYLVNLSKFKTNGWYDEDFSGNYGYEDLYMPRVWERHDGKRHLFNDADYFESIDFGTTGLSRDLAHNKALAERKLASGIKNSTGILRFEWEQIQLPKG